MGDNIILTVAPEGASGEAWQKREGKNGQNIEASKSSGICRRAGFLDLSSAAPRGADG